MLWRRHGESMSDLNEAIGWPRPDARLNRIKGKVRRGDRDGKYFEMGDNIAREIEQALGLTEGWMDTPPTYAELAGEDDPKAKVMAVMEQMSADMQQLLAQLGDTMLKQTMGGGPTPQTIDGPAQIGNSQRPMLTNQSQKE